MGAKSPWETGINKEECDVNLSRGLRGRDRSFKPLLAVKMEIESRRRPFPSRAFKVVTTFQNRFTVLNSTRNSQD